MATVKAAGCLGLVRRRRSAIGTGCLRLYGSPFLAGGWGPDGGPSPLGRGWPLLLLSLPLLAMGRLLVLRLVELLPLWVLELQVLGAVPPGLC